MSELRYSYYPGCSLHASASEYDLSTREVFAALGIGLDEVPDWICCGATPAHNVDELLSLSLCAKNLELAEQVPGDMAVACAACFSRLKFAQHVLKGNVQKLHQVEQAIDARVPLDQPVKHLLEILVQDLGAERLSLAVKKPLAGLKVACYYGCLLTRPPEVPQLDDCEALRLWSGCCRQWGPRLLTGPTGWNAAVPTLLFPVPGWCCS